LERAEPSLQAIACTLYIDCMAGLTIRRLEEPLKARLRIRAATNGHSMEEEARTILRAALNRDPPEPGNLYESIRARIAERGGFDLELPPREPMRDPPTFD
jgi:plasmid stability protein